VQPPFRGALPGCQGRRPARPGNSRQCPRGADARLGNQLGVAAPAAPSRRGRWRSAGCTVLSRCTRTSSICCAGAPCAKCSESPWSAPTASSSCGSVGSSRRRRLRSSPAPPPRRGRWRSAGCTVLGHTLHESVRAALIVEPAGGLVELRFGRRPLVWAVRSCRPAALAAGESAAERRPHLKGTPYPSNSPARQAPPLDPGPTEALDPRALPRLSSWAPPRAVRPARVELVPSCSRLRAPSLPVDGDFRPGLSPPPRTPRAALSDFDGEGTCPLEAERWSRGRGDGGGWRDPPEPCFPWPLVRGVAAQPSPTVRTVLVCRGVSGSARRPRRPREPA
jgi:hypothetical protein